MALARVSSLAVTLLCLCFAVAAAQISHGAEDASALIQSSVEGLAMAKVLHASEELEEAGEEEQLEEGGTKPAPGSPHGKAAAKRPVPQKPLPRKPQPALKKAQAGKPLPRKPLPAQKKAQAGKPLPRKPLPAQKKAQQGKPKLVAKKQEDKKKAAIQANRKVADDATAKRNVEPAQPTEVHLVIAGPLKLNNVTLKVPTKVHLGVAATTAAREFGLAPSEVHGLKFNGRTMNLTQTLLEIGLRDGDFLQMKV